MSNTSVKKPLVAAIGAAVVGSLAATGAVAADNPFGMKQLNSGYMQVAQEGSCGGMKKEAAKTMEGSCGGSKAAAEGKCGEGKCGESKAAATKSAEGKCGEGKCGESKAAPAKAVEGKCGEGKCGGSK